MNIVTIQEKMRAKEAELSREENSQKWVPADIPIPPKPKAIPEPSRQSSERGISPNRPSLSMSWGQGIKAKLDIPLPNSKKAPIVGKMPWLKKDGRASKFGPPVTNAVAAVPPPTLVTTQPKLGTGVQDTSLPNLPTSAPPPTTPTFKPSQTSTPTNAVSGFGFDTSRPPPPLPNKSKVDRNPKPAESVNMAAMLAAAQKHMQASLNTKMQKIGFPPQIAGGLTEPAEAIPLPTIPLPTEMPGIKLIFLFILGIYHFRNFCIIFNFFL